MSSHQQQLVQLEVTERKLVDDQWDPPFCQSCVYFSLSNFGSAQTGKVLRLQNEAEPEHCLSESPVRELLACMLCSVTTLGKHPTLLSQNIQNFNSKVCHSEGGLVETKRDVEPWGFQSFARSLLRAGGASDGAIFEKLLSFSVSASAKELVLCGRMWTWNYPESYDSSFWVRLLQQSFE